MRGLLFVAAAALALAAPALSQPVEVVATPVSLDPADPGRVMVGRLTFLAGFELSAATENWGGFSGMVLGPEGTLLAVSDLGYWLKLELRHGEDGRLAGVGAAELGPLLDEAGKPPAGKLAGDAEAVAVHGGEIWVAFEQRHRLRRYRDEGVPAGPAREVRGPADLPTLPANEGVEGMVRLTDGRTLLAAEGPGYAGGDPIAWLGKEHAWDALSIRRTGDFSPTDLALLPSGDVLLVERRFTLLSGPGARLSVLPADTIRPGARLTGEELARLSLPLTVDNFEAVAVRETADAIHLYLMSDDNRNPLQRTLLLQFRLEP